MYRVVAVALLLTLLMSACTGAAPSDSASEYVALSRETSAQQNEQVVKVYKPPT